MEVFTLTGLPPQPPAVAAAAGGVAFDADAVLRAAESEAPGRRAVLEQLIAALSPPPLQSVFVYGPSGSGKTHTLTTLLKHMPCRAAIVNCVEAYTTRLLFEHCLNALAAQLPSHNNQYRGFARCDSMYDFVTHVTNIIDHSENPYQTTVLVLDRCERLRDFKPTILAALMRLGELVQRNICVVLVSSLVWAKFQGGTGLPDPYLVHVPAYDKAETVTILSRLCPPSVAPWFYSRFVELMWDVFHGPCRDLNELHHIVALLYPIYRRPVDDEEVEETNAVGLYKKLAPVLKEQLSKLYLRETSTAEWLAQHDDSGKAEPAGQVSARLELPFHAKYLLLAAYMASHNPARTDLSYFSRRQSTRGRKKTTGAAVAAAKAADKDTGAKGPSTFSLDRLLAIFYTINASQVNSTAEIYSQIRSLVSLRLLQQVTADDNLDEPKYKCLLLLSDARRLAQSVQFDLISHLYRPPTEG